MSKPVGFGKISMSFFNFLRQKTWAVEFSRPEVVWKVVRSHRKVVFKMSAEAHQYVIY